MPQFTRQVRTGPPARGPGPMETALERDLKALPKHLRESTLAESIRQLAKRIDGGMSHRDAMSAHREIRVSLAELLERAPLRDEGDKGDELAARRQARLAAER